MAIIIIGSHCKKKYTEHNTTQDGTTNRITKRKK